MNMYHIGLIIIIALGLAWMSLDFIRWVRDVYTMWHIRRNYKRLTELYLERDFRLSDLEESDERLEDKDQFIGYR